MRKFRITRLKKIKNRYIKNKEIENGCIDVQNMGE